MSEQNEPESRGDRGLARPEETEAFKPRVNWKLWLPIFAVLSAFVVSYFVVENMREKRNRALLLREHALLTGPLAPDYRAARGKVERFAASVPRVYEGDFVAEGFTIQALRSSPVLYGRVRLSELRDRAAVVTSIRHHYDDQVAACLGLEINWVWRFFDRGDFLTTAYVDSLRPASGSERLRFLREDLRTRIQRDTADLVQWGRAQRFVLSVDEGTSQIDGPTRVYVWDLRTEQPLLRGRGAGDDTVIIPVRIAGMPGGGRPVPRPTGALTVTAHDCDIANHVRLQLGAAAPEAAHAPTVEMPSLNGDGGAANGAAISDGGSEDSSVARD